MKNPYKNTKFSISFQLYIIFTRKDFFHLKKKNSIEKFTNFKFFIRIISINHNSN